MPKIMLFVDGTWLYSNTPRLAEAYGQADFRVDFGKLPSVLADAVADQFGGANPELDVVRTYLFGSYATNHDPRDTDVVQRRRDFFDMLKQEYHYQVQTYPINFAGRRLRRADRDPTDPFEPREKCVDISLAATMLYYAAIANAYDIGVAVVGDQDFKPVFQQVRRLGKRVAIASIKGSCSPELSDPRDEAGVKDFDIIWLNDLLHKLELKYERQRLRCESPIHQGNREVWTTFRPRKGQKFFCEACRREYGRQKTEAEHEFAPVREQPAPPAEQPEGSGDAITGVVTRKFPDRGFGFIDTDDGKSYFFHLTDLQGGLYFEDVYEGLDVDFLVEKPPANDKAGAAQNVRVHRPAEEAEAEAEEEAEDEDVEPAAGDDRDEMGEMEDIDEIEDEEEEGNDE